MTGPLQRFSWFSLMPCSHVNFRRGPWLYLNLLCSRKQRTKWGGSFPLCKEELVGWLERKTCWKEGRRGRHVWHDLVDCLLAGGRVHPRPRPAQGQGGHEQPRGRVWALLSNTVADPAPRGSGDRKPSYWSGGPEPALFSAQPFCLSKRAWPRAARVMGSSPAWGSVSPGLLPCPRGLLAASL